VSWEKINVLGRALAFLIQMLVFCSVFRVMHNIRITQQVVLSLFYLQFKFSDFLIVLKVLTLKTGFNKQ
jgi:hypothetical protein